MAFLVLHEITAVVPVAAIFYGIHVSNVDVNALVKTYLPSGVVDEAHDRAARVLQRYGWLDDSRPAYSLRLVLEGTTAYGVGFLISCWQLTCFPDRKTIITCTHSFLSVGNTICRSFDPQVACSGHPCTLCTPCV